MDKSPRNGQHERPARHFPSAFGLWLVVGVAIGAAYGVSQSNLALWVAIGAAGGLLVGFAMRFAHRND